MLKNKYPVAVGQSGVMVMVDGFFAEVGAATFVNGKEGEEEKGFHLFDLGGKREMLSF